MITQIEFHHCLHRMRTVRANLSFVILFIFRSDILSLLRTYNCYHEGKNFQLRTREVKKKSSAADRPPELVTLKPKLGPVNEDKKINGLPVWLQFCAKTWNSWVLFQHTKLLVNHKKPPFSTKWKWEWKERNLRFQSYTLTAEQSTSTVNILLMRFVCKAVCKSLVICLICILWTGVPLCVH